MNPLAQYAVAYAAVLLLFFFLKPQALRTWIGGGLFVLGFVALFALPPFVAGVDIGIFAIAAVAAGGSLLFSRGRYRDEEA